MRIKWPLGTMLCFLMLALTPIISAAEWTDIHQNQSSSHTVTMAGDGYYMDPSNAYDGVGSQSGDPVLLRTQTCFSGSSPSAGTTIEIDYTLVTNQSSKPFYLIFNLVFIGDSDAPDGYASVAVYNKNSFSYVEVVNSTSTGGADYNISRSSSYMDDVGNVLVKLKSGHSVQDCDASTETRVYEFDIYSNLQQQAITDADGDGIEDGDDSCPNGMNDWISTPSTDYDADGCKDSVEDDDDDGDGRNDLEDSCPKGEFFISSPGVDYDGDGCLDSSEDNDDDNDSINDSEDQCQTGKLNWISSSVNDYDQDGCEDTEEDLDDDNDGLLDVVDTCSHGSMGWFSSQQLDYDLDGCLDDVEDVDDDNDGILDSNDSCPHGELNWLSSDGSDHDHDGCKDSVEDNDDDNDLALDVNDECPRGVINWDRAINDYDGDGCHDESEDLNDDNDALDDVNDLCPRGYLASVSSLNEDWDADGCFDLEDSDDDNDNLNDTIDGCPKGNIAFNGDDWDNDGCQDSTEDSDDDNDGRGDGEDHCPAGMLNWTSSSELDYDLDGCNDLSEDLDDDEDFVPDINDSCQLSLNEWQSNTISDYDQDGCADIFEDDDDDNDTIEDDRDECQKGILNWESNQVNDWDNDGCLDESEDLDDDNDGVFDTNDQCPQTIDYPIDGNGCTLVETKSIEENSNIVTKIVVGGVSGFGLAALIMFMFVSGGSGWVAKALMDEFEDPTSSSLIDRLEVIQGSSDKTQPLFTTNHQYRELIQQMSSHFEVHKQKYHQISISAVNDVLGKMEAKTFTQIGAALFFRALLTCIGRIHLERMNTNGYPNQLVDKKTKRKASGHQIVNHFSSDILSGKVSRSHTRKLKKWLWSFDRHNLFAQLNERVQFWSRVVHVEDPNSPDYTIEQLNEDCELLLSYTRGLITHPPWPSVLKDQ